MTPIQNESIPSQVGQVSLPGTHPHDFPDNTKEFSSSCYRRKHEKEQRKLKKFNELVRQLNKTSGTKDVSAALRKMKRATEYHPNVGEITECKTAEEIRQWQEKRLAEFDRLKDLSRLRQHDSLSLSDDDIVDYDSSSESSSSSRRSILPIREEVQRSITELRESDETKEEILSFISSLKTQLKIPRFVDHIEGIFLLCYSLRGCSSIDSAITIFLLYSRGYCLKESIVRSLVNLISPSEYTPQVGIDDINKAFDDWQAFLRLPAFKYIGRIVAVCVSLGMCSASNLEWNVGGVTLFSQNALQFQATSIDFLDAVIKTIKYFLNAGVEAYRTGSIRPFLYDDNRLARLDEQFNKVSVSMGLLSSGNLSNAPFTNEADLSGAITKLLSELDQLKKIEKDPVMRRIVDQRMGQANSWKYILICKTTGGKLRMAPYTFFIWGPSGLGKTAISANMTKTLLAANGHPSDDDTRIVTINPSDKFMSNAKSDTLAFIFDDMGAESPASQEIVLGRRWLDMSNNQTGYAMKAEAQDKGMCSFNHALQVGTSNTVNGGMDVLMTYPVAVARRGSRDHFVLKPAYKDKTGKYDQAKVIAQFGNSRYPDVYDITVQKAVERPNTNGAYDWVTEEFTENGTTIKMANVSYATYAKYHIQESIKHFAQQKMFVASSGVNVGYTFCQTCSGVGELCLCPPPPPVYTKQVGMQLLHRVLEAAIYTRTLEYVEGPLTAIEVAADDAFENASMLRAFFLLPDFLFQTQFIQGMIRHRISEKTLGSPRLTSVLTGLCVLLAVTMLYFRNNLSCFTLLVVFIFSFALKLCIDQLVFEFFIARYEDERRAFQHRLREIRRISLKYVLGGAALLAALSFWATMRKKKDKEPEFKVQGNISPTSFEEVKERDKEVNVWATVVPSPLEASDKAKRSCYEHVMNSVQANQLYVVCETDGKKYFANASMVKTGFCSMPAHFLTKAPRKFVFSRSGPEILGAHFSAVISRDDAYIVPESDIAIVYVPSCGDYRDLTPYLARGIVNTGWCGLIYKKEDGTFTSNKIVSFKRMLMRCEGLAQPEFNALSYSLPYTTFDGLCGATLLLCDKIPLILGYHSMGTIESPRGGASILSFEAFDLAQRTLCEKFSSIAVLAKPSDIPKAQYGISYVLSESVDKKSPACFQPKEVKTNGRIYGTVMGKSKMYSGVVRTSVYSEVKRVLKVPYDFGPPKFHLGTHWHTHLTKCLNPSVGCSQSLLERAMKDYCQVMPDIVHIMKSEMRPMTDSEAINGIDGMRFMERLKPNTSMGYPLNKSKDHYLIDGEGENVCNKDFPPVIWKSVEEMKAGYRLLMRMYPIFRSSGKDEVKDWESIKVRIFEVAPIALSILLRKYFLPIARVVSLFPLSFECAVGINSQSREWDQLMKHVTKFGKDRMIAGDYSNFDNRMPAQFTIAAFKCLIKMAEMSGNYSEDDLLIMNSMIADVVHPLMACNGDLVMFHGTNPSGQNLTTYVNSIVNALYLRVCFFSKYNGDFRSNVAIATYGDDFIGSVNENCPDFHFGTIRDHLKTMGIIITLPDKKGDEGEYLSEEKCDFLKRRSRYVPELGHEVGVLDEKSIVRSLMYQVSSNQLPSIALAGALRSALQEWWFHGRQLFEERRENMKEVFHNFPLVVPELDRDFDEVLASKLL